MSNSASDGRRTAVLVDAHPLWLELLEQVALSAEISVVATTTERIHAVELISSHEPDILVLGDSGPARDASGSHPARQYRSQFPGLSIVVVSGHDDPAVIESALAAGADVYVLKTALRTDIVASLRQLSDRTIVLLGRDSVAASPRLVAPQSTAPRLTKREQEILGLVANGLSNSEVADALVVSNATVKVYLSRIYQKLNVPNRTAASHWAHIHGVIGADPRAVRRPSKARTEIEGRASRR
jgi:DNA-binding NarL/FixJ family response regulator